MDAMTKRARGAFAKGAVLHPCARRDAIWRGDAGASLVELALLTPVLLLLSLGVIEYGRYEYFSILVANAAREGAQYGSQNLGTAADTPGIQLAASQDAQSLSELTVTSVEQCGCTGSALSSTCPASGCTAPGHPLVYVQVTASATINSLFNYPGIPSSLTLSSTDRMRVTQ